MKHVAARNEVSIVLQQMYEFTVEILQVLGLTSSKCIMNGMFGIRNLSS